MTGNREDKDLDAKMIVLFMREPDAYACESLPARACSRR